MKTSGLKLNFEEDGGVTVKEGERQRPHRVELVEQAFKDGDYKKAAEMVFNFKIKNCRHATNSEILARENKLCDKLVKILEGEEVELFC